MDGANQAAGAVAGVQRVRNPILLAQTVMQKSRHVMMVGQGAEAFAAEQGIPLVDPSYFRTEKRWQQLQRALKEEASGEHMPTRRLQSTLVPLVRSHWTRRGIWPPAPPPGHDQQALRPGR